MNNVYMLYPLLEVEWNSRPSVTIAEGCRFDSQPVRVKDCKK